MKPSEISDLKKKFSEAFVFSLVIAFFTNIALSFLVIGITEEMERTSPASFYAPYQEASPSETVQQYDSPLNLLDLILRLFEEVKNLFQCLF